MPQILTLVYFFHLPQLIVDTTCGSIQNCDFIPNGQLNIVFTDVIFIDFKKYIYAVLHVEEKTKAKTVFEKYVNDTACRYHSNSCHYGYCTGKIINSFRGRENAPRKNYVANTLVQVLDGEARLVHLLV